MAIPERLLGLRGFIFDMDGTLTDSMPFHIRAWQQVLERRGISEGKEYFLAHGGVPSFVMGGKLRERFGLTESAEALAREKTENYRRLIPGIRAFPWVVPFLTEARERGIRLAVGTGTLRENARDVLRAAGISGFFDTVVTSADVTRYKPEPDTFLLCAERLGLRPSECAVFEDSPLGFEAAKRGVFSLVKVMGGQLCA